MITLEADCVEGLQVTESNAVDTAREQVKKRVKIYFYRALNTKKIGCAKKCWV
jgi:hypothetical protein